MKTQKKFSTIIDEEVLDNLKNYASSTGRSISNIVEISLVEYLDKKKLRPIFRDAMKEVLNENATLFEKLSK